VLKKIRVHFEAYHCEYSYFYMENFRVTDTELKPRTVLFSV